MTDLAVWLLEQIAEDERAASHAHPYDGSALDVRSYDGDSEIIVSKGRVLAECEAKRRIVEVHPPGAPCSQACSCTRECETCSVHGYDVDHGEPYRVGDDWPCPTLRLLAEPYADRPGYDETWRP